ncbi:putative mitochondrial carrier protein [Hyaloraphidium curvatum]|nr:putative mitochondrial carrier protein [Hyaloraphidium curvatum]
MAPAAQKGDPRDLAVGALLATTEALTLGLPLEIWKTRQGAHPEEWFWDSWKKVAYGPKGLRGLWAGWDAKGLEAASKGAVLLYAKEYILDACATAGMERGGGLAGALAGAGGGVAQTVVMSPLTYVITYKLKSPDGHGKSTFEILKNAGLRGMYSSAPAMAARQASNWALRQGITDAITDRYRQYRGGKLTTAERIGCGVLGGFIACINQPTEVVRIRIQALHAQGNKSATTGQVVKMIWQERGFLGFYAAMLPRACLSAYQTVFMVTFPPMVKQFLADK